MAKQVFTTLPQYELTASFGFAVYVLVPVNFAGNYSFQKFVGSLPFIIGKC